MIRNVHKIGKSQKFTHIQIYYIDYCDFRHILQL